MLLWTLLLNALSLCSFHVLRDQVSHPYVKRKDKRYSVKLTCPYFRNGWNFDVSVFRKNLNFPVFCPEIIWCACCDFGRHSVEETVLETLRVAVLSAHFPAINVIIFPSFPLSIILSLSFFLNDILEVWHKLYVFIEWDIFLVCLIARYGLFVPENPTAYFFLTFCCPCISVYLSQHLTNMMHKICFTISFISCLYMFRARDGHL